MQDQDWSLVLQTSASIFEALAKMVVPLASVKNQSLGAFFDPHAALSAPPLDVIHEVYKRRNIEPLAGHGPIENPAITRKEAIQGGSPHSCAEGRRLRATSDAGAPPPLVKSATKSLRPSSMSKTASPSIGTSLGGCEWLRPALAANKHHA
jgi:hypothetical protein